MARASRAAPLTAAAWIVSAIAALGSGSARADAPGDASRGLPLVAASHAAGPVAASHAAGADPRRAVTIHLVQPRDPWWIGRVAFSVRVEPPRGDRVERVELSLDDLPAVTCRHEPYRLVHDFGESLIGHRLGIVARTVSGLTGTLTVVSSEPTLSQRAEVELVLVPVTVLGPDGAPLLDLSREEFTLFEEDSRQPIDSFDPDPAPVSLVFGLDCSGSMEKALPFVKAAAITFLQKLPKRFSAAFFAFDERPGPLVDFTLDRSHLYYEIGRRQARGTGTAILSACQAALSALRARPGRKAAAIFTDGEETLLPEDARQGAVRALADQALRADVELYFVVYGRETRSPLTELIASATGGESLPGGSPRRVNEAFSRIGARLGAQYTIGYRPRTPARPGEWRRLRVEVARPGAIVAARAGWGPPGPSRH